MEGGGVEGGVVVVLGRGGLLGLVIGEMGGD